MFTGLIEEMGKIKTIKRTRQGMELTIQGKKVMEKLSIGDSIACDGVCLTVNCFGRDWYSVDVMEETLRETTLLKLKTGNKVNLERAMEAGGRFGGHMVSGHVDGTGKVVAVQQDGFATIVEICCGDELLEGMVNKGSVAVNGVSLTISAIVDGGFQFSMIPHTKSETKELTIGDEVNLEQDLVGKYVTSFLHKKQENNISQRGTGKSKITEAFLRDNQF